MVVTHLPSIVDRTLKSRAWPLDAATRTAMERRFDHDFSGVRVHADAQAARSAEAMHARAYTVGRNIARVKGEEFGDRHGLPQYEKRYRSRRGKPRIWSITRDVKKSSHYNPTDKKRVDRRYTGEELTSGWED